MMSRFITFLCFVLFLLSSTTGHAQSNIIGMFDVLVELKDGVAGNSATPERDVVIHKRVNFIFNQSVANIFFEDGTPLQSVGGLSVEHTYATGGTKKVKVSSLGESYEFEIVVKEPKVGVSYQSPDAIWEITTAEPFSSPCESAAYPIASDRPVQGTASAYIKFGAGHNGKLVRPIIFVDGVDFDETKFTDPAMGNQIIRHGSTGWDVLVMGMEDSALDEPENGVPDRETFGNYPSAFTSLTQSSSANGNGSYDIIFLDFSQGADYIQRNGLLLIELIRRVNSEKVADANGKKFKNVVVGASMGGQIARLALATMEKKGEDHCTHTYVSFDSPHKGANIPLSVQAMGWYLTAIQASSLSPKLSDFWKKLRKPATQQMLFQHFGAEIQNGGLSARRPPWAFQLLPLRLPREDYTCLRQRYMEEMTSLGYPKNTRNIAISDGSVLASSVNQGYEGGSELIDVNMANPTALGNIFAQIQLYAGAARLDHISTAYVRSFCPGTPGGGFVSRSMPMELRNSVIFAAAVPNLLALSCGYDAISVQVNRNMPQLDHVAGCVRKDIATIKKILKSAEISSINVNLDDVNYRRRTCFMPTMSTLDLDWDMSNSNLSRDIDPNMVLQNRNTPFADFFAPGVGTTSENLKHVEIIPEMITWLQGQMAIGQALGTVMLPNSTAQQLIFTEDGLINRNYIVNNGGLISLNGNPSVKVTVAGCDATQVDVNNGGNFNIGSAATVGEVVVKTNSVVKVAGGGNLNLINNSQLIIENGGRLIIEAGANINLVGLASKITIKQGGELVINSVNSSDPNFNFSGSGYFNFEAGNILTLNSDWVLRGSGKTTRLINIGHGATVSINGGRRLTIQDALIRKEANVSNQDVMLFNNGSTFFANNVTFDDQSSGGGAFAFVAVDEPVDLDNSQTDMDYSFRNCAFSRSDMGVFLGGEMGDRFDFRNLNVEFINTTFTNCKTAYLAQHSWESTFDGCTILGGGMELQRTYWLQIRNTIMRGRRSVTGDNSTIGVKLSGSIHNWITNNSLISDYGTGIDAFTGTIAGGVNLNINGNIRLADRMTIQLCETAVRQLGGADFGLLYMDCTRLLENANGVVGTDLLMAAHTRNNTANIFRRPPTNPSVRFFDVAFSVRQLTELWFHGTYWDNQRPTMQASPTTETNNAAWRFSQRSNTGHLWPWGGQIYFDPVVFLGSNDVENCGGIVNGFAPDVPVLTSNAVVVVGGLSRDLRIQQTAAMTELSNNNLTRAIQLFTPIASVDNATRDASNTTVQHFVDVARVMTRAEGVTTRSNTNYWLPETLVKTPIKVENNELIVSPNPANDAVQLTIKSGNYHLRVSNAVGQTIFQQNTEGATSINVATWTNGIYLFELTDKATNKQQRSKIVVQH